MIPTARDNILRVLRHYGWEFLINITEEGPYYVKAWPMTDGLLKNITLLDWPQDPNFASQYFHGTKVAFREPGDVSPALQVCFHPLFDRYDKIRCYFIEIDLDYHAPVGLKGKIRHGLEVLGHKILGKKTNQEKVAKMLDKRFKKHESRNSKKGSRSV